MPGPMVNDAASETNSNKPIPANIEAEKSVLAACILNGDILEEILLKLKPEDFSGLRTRSSSKRSST